MINSLRIAASAIALSAAITGVAVAAPHTFTARDMASLERLSDPRVSPDGAWVLYDLRHGQRCRRPTSSAPRTVRC